MKGKGTYRKRKRRIKIDSQLLAEGNSARTRCYAYEKHHHHLVSSVMQVMKTHLRNTRSATKAPLYYTGKVYIYSVIYTQYNTNPYLKKGKVKLYLHLATVSDVSEYLLKITAFCLFLKTSISLLRLRLNPANTNIIRLCLNNCSEDNLSINRPLKYLLTIRYGHD